MTTDDINYQGPNLEYEPSLKGLEGVRTNFTSENPTRGYYDLDYLNEMLDEISNAASATYSFTEKKLAGYSLKLDNVNPDLEAAHNQVYPADETPGYITFDEYKYLLTLTPSVAVDYVRSYYESKLRGPTGSEALDLLLLARTIHSEVSRIRNFIDTFIGELDETAEFRIIELFQDWTETARAAIKRIDQTAKTQVSAEISRAELDELTPDLSTRYQVLFQTKLNQINALIGESVNKLEKNWNTPSYPFYIKTLGPALTFQIKIAGVITDPNNLNSVMLPTLATEAKGTISGLASNYNTALSDQMRRNQLFGAYIEAILNNIDQRDVYKSYIDQLGKKGTTIPSEFVESSTVEQSDGIFDAPHPLSHTLNSISNSTSAWASHQDLLDRLVDDAHPQYLLKTGGHIEGDITFADGVTIDGVDISEHKHDGLDGSSKISGSDIIPGTITEDNLNPTATTSSPYNLVLTNQVGTIVPPGITKVVAEVGFSVDNTANIVGYEFEVVKLQ